MKSPKGLDFIYLYLMDFKEYLTNKKIDSDAYKASEPDQWVAFATIFEQMHPKSFTLQKLNLINGIRRQFPHTERLVEKDQVKPKVARPMMKPKTQPTTKISSDASKKPIIKPKISADKPKMAKPVLKPKMGKPKMITDQPEENKKEVKPKPVMKPKMVRPVMKPKPKDPTE